MANPRVHNLLQSAWSVREKTGSLERPAVRLFHGPGEGQGPLASVAVDRFGEHLWVTQWESGETSPGGALLADEIATFYQEKGFVSGVALWRPEKGVPAEPVKIFGDPPREPFVCSEEGARFWIRVTEVRHPGLFLDHAPLRAWLARNSRGLEVLNTFAYTGSLSIAAARGGATKVTTLDLSRPTIDWARSNWKLNELAEDAADFIYGDYFDWIPRMVRKDRRFDLVILDPPSFSRGKKGSFSTAKDLVRLHEAAMPLLRPGGFLVTSINSASVPREAYRAEVDAAAQSCGMRFEVVREIEPPDTFPRGPANPGREGPELKGWILKRTNG